MKFQVEILFVVYSAVLISCIDSTPSNDDHKHHKESKHHKDSESECLSKLDDLHMGEIIALGQQFTDSVSIIEAQLIDLIQEQIDKFAASRDELRASFQSQVESVQKTLNDHARDLSLSNMEADDTFWECLNNAANFVRIDLPGTLMAQADACIEANFNDLKDIEAQMVELNETALADLNRICDCVDCISCSPSKTEKKLVEVCVNNTVQLLDIEIVSNKAFSILNQVEEIGEDLFASLQACIGQIDLNLALNTITLQMDSCPSDVSENPR